VQGSELTALSILERPLLHSIQKDHHLFLSVFHIEAELVDCS